MDVRVAQEQIARLKSEGCWAALKSSAAQQGLPLAFVLAIASRETNCRNELGDFHDDLYHAVGPMQIDIQHEMAQRAMADHSWKEHPEPLIEFGCQLLGVNRARIHHDYPGLSEADGLRFTAASYNAGLGGAERGHAEGDCDRYTTGRNYGADVMSRMPAFEQALAKGPRPTRKVPVR